MCVLQVASSDHEPITRREQAANDRPFAFGWPDIYNVDNLAEHLGTFEQAVLLTLIRPQTPLGKEAYGRAILKEVQHRLKRDVAAGAVYATLERLEAKGLISSRLEPGTPVRGGRPKRHYAIEPPGIRALNAAKAAADRLWAGVRAPLKGAGAT